MKSSRFACAVFACLTNTATHAGMEDDPHYTPAGFFDTHVCNWPEKPRFLMALFSTVRFDELAGVAIYSPNGSHLGDLDLSLFRAFKTESGHPKRAFISHLDLPANAVDGWYRAVITLKDGSRFESRDYVIHRIMGQPTGMQPAPNAVDVPATTALGWDPIPGARFYEVFLRDEWTATTTTSSGLLTEPRFAPPQGLLQSDGEYVWRIHARDSDGTVLLGDFNHGSLSPEMRFRVK
jgi:hypothetical protein